MEGGLLSTNQQIILVVRRGKYFSKKTIVFKSEKAVNFLKKITFKPDDAGSEFRIEELA
jgi:hypothetical protein